MIHTQACDFVVFQHTKMKGGMSKSSAMSDEQFEIIRTTSRQFGYPPDKVSRSTLISTGDDEASAYSPLAARNVYMVGSDKK